MDQQVVRQDKHQQMLEKFWGSIDFKLRDICWELEEGLEVLAVEREQELGAVDHLVLDIEYDIEGHTALENGEWFFPFGVWAQLHQPQPFHILVVHLLFAAEAVLPESAAEVGVVLTEVHGLVESLFELKHLKQFAGRGRNGKILINLVRLNGLADTVGFEVG